MRAPTDAGDGTAADPIVPPPADPGDRVAVVAAYNPDAPVVCNVDVGHTHPVVPVPVGGRCVVDPAEERVAFPGFEG
jgi:muramoyltetrapeptide carboxypeptidase LdcA involved in peptidoglycan recycling